jgi:hypothetical protein
MTTYATFLEALHYFSLSLSLKGMGALFGARDQYTAAFGLFFALTAYSLYFVHRHVPETKGLSLLQIEALLQGEGDSVPTSPRAHPGSSSRSGGGAKAKGTHQRGSASIEQSLNGGLSTDSAGRRLNPLLSADMGDKSIGSYSDLHDDGDLA